MIYLNKKRSLHLRDSEVRLFLPTKDRDLISIEDCIYISE